MATLTLNISVSLPFRQVQRSSVQCFLAWGARYAIFFLLVWPGDPVLQCFHQFGLESQLCNVFLSLAWRAYGNSRVYVVTELGSI